MRRALALALLLALPTGAAGGGARHVAFVEERTVHELSGTLDPGASQAFRIPVRAENVTRVLFHLRWAGEATLSLAVLDPFGRAAAPPVSGAGGDLWLDAGEVAPLPAPLSVPAEGLADALAASVSRAGRGEWRIAVQAGEWDGASASYALEVEVTRYQAVTLSEVTLKGADAGLAGAWPLVLPVLGAAVLGLGVALACSRKVAHSVVPSGDKAPSPTGERERCASER